MSIIRFLFRAVVFAASFVLRLVVSLILGLIVGLLAMAYLNASSRQRERIGNVMVYVLGERQPSTLKVQEAVVIQRQDGGYEIQHA